MATDDVRLRVVRGDRNNNTVIIIILLLQTYCKLLSSVHSRPVPVLVIILVIVFASTTESLMFIRVKLIAA